MNSLIIGIFVIVKLLLQIQHIYHIARDSKWSQIKNDVAKKPSKQCVSFNANDFNL